MEDAQKVHALLNAMRRNGFVIVVARKPRPGTWMEHVATTMPPDTTKCLRAAMTEVGWKAQGRNMMPDKQLNGYYFQKGSVLGVLSIDDGHIEFC